MFKWNQKWKGYYPFNTNIEYELKDRKGYVKDFYDIYNNNSSLYFEDDVKLGFEGEYLNGKRNRKGKEYFDKLIFEGEYLNEKKMEKEENIMKMEN